MITYETVSTPAQLSAALEMIYPILEPTFGGGSLREREIYSPAAWSKRLTEYPRVLCCAYDDEAPIAAMFGRAENPENITVGAVACLVEYRKQGITRKLMKIFEQNAEEYGFKYATLGADTDAEGFYEKCGYQVITEMHGQKIYQKVLKGDK